MSLTARNSVPAEPVASVQTADFVPSFGFIESSLFGFVCLFMFVGAVIAIIVLVRILARQGQVARSLTDRSSPPRAPFLGTAQVRAVDDGFWIVLPDTPIGSMVRHRFRVRGGGEQISTFRYEPGPEGQFIHVGERPYDIDVLDVIHPGLSFGPRGISSPRVNWPHNDPRHFQHPSPVPELDTTSSGGGGDFGDDPSSALDPDTTSSGGGGDFGGDPPAAPDPDTMPSGGGGDFGGDPSPALDPETAPSGGGGDFGGDPPAY